MLSFLNASLIPWAAAASVPLVIHLLTRKTRRRMELPTVKFLQRTLAHQSSLFKWRHLILLLLRTLAVLALVLAFTKPTLMSPLAAQANERAGVIALLDVSESMGYNAGGLSSLAKAKSEAIKALQSLRSSDKANLIFCSAQPTAAVSEPTNDINLLINAVRAANVTEERADPAGALSLAVEQLAKANTQAKRLYIFSDFQRTNWADVKFDSVPGDTKIIFVNTDASSRDNTGISALRLRPSTPRVGETVMLSCEVFNSSGVSKTVPVSLSFSNGGHYEQNAALGAYSSANVNFPLVFSSPERIECAAQIPADNLAADNTRRAVIDLQQSASVVLITDENINSASGASFYLAHALHPDPASNAGFRVTAVKPNALNNPLLKSADAVIVCNAPSMPEVQYQALAKYMTEGGNLIWFLYGERTAQQLAGVGKYLPKAEPMPLQVMSIANISKQGKGFVNLSEISTESQPLKAFKDPATSDLGKIKFYRFCITSEVAPRAETLLKFEDGTAAAVRSGEGSGNLLLLNLSPAPSWSDLARQEVFLPLLHELLKGTLMKESNLREYYPGGPASASIAPTKAKLTCADPEGRDVPVTMDRSTGSIVIDKAKKSGFYHLSADGKPAASIAVNPHPDEIDLRSIDPRELESQRQKESSFLSGMSGKEADVNDLNKGRPLWHYLLLAALLFLLVEQLVNRVKPKTAVPKKAI